MAGTAKSYDSTKIILGPGDLWAKVSVPSAGARMTLYTDGTPDATANTTAKHVGMTKAGCEVSYKPSTADFEADELTSPFLSRLITEELAIKGEMFQVFDFALLYAMTVGGTYNTNTSTTSGYEELTIGGLSAITTYSIALIAPDINAPTTKWVTVQLYKSYNSAGWNFTVTRKQPASLPFEFKGLSVATRTAGDQVGNIFKNTV